MTQTPTSLRRVIEPATGVSGITLPRDPTPGMCVSVHNRSDRPVTVQPHRTVAVGETVVFQYCTVDEADSRT